MSWWGKLLGGAFGFAIGGPLGALLGAALGHNFDRGLSGLKNYGIGDGAVDNERLQSAFFATTFSVMGHLAKADGRVSPEEIAMARNVMLNMQLSPEQREIAMKLFNEGKQADFPLDDVLTQFRQECHRRHNLMQMFLEILIATSLADSNLDDAERGLLIYIGAQLGFARPQIEQLINMVAAQQRYTQHGGAQSAAQRADSLKDAYKILGVAESANNDEIKTAYRRLMNQHHPDKLVSKGLPEEMMKLATEKTQEIKQAYEHIMDSRK